ncbi:helix-turn-helix transcriptional regulator [Nonomuraea dietziae]|uniref:helix-turn-helix transcriptional regulator n=1 Tax=Nonomuraea dietziae TaxID=65515 RepID=UPI00341E99BC
MMHMEKTSFDPLEPSDYRRMLGVLEDLSADLAHKGLQERLPAALTAHFGWRAAVFDGRAWAPQDGHAAIVSAVTGRRNERWYQAEDVVCAHSSPAHLHHGLVVLSGPVLHEGAHRTGPAHTVVAKLTAHGTAATYLSVAFPVGTVRRRQLVILCTLSRHLSLRLHSSPATFDVRRRWGLTRREHEVAELVAEGLTNDQIAERLFISVDTVKKHLTQALSKSWCSSRTQLAIMWQATPSAGPTAQSA